MLSRQVWFLFVGSIALSVALAVAITQPGAQGFIENSGVNIPTSDVVRDYAYGIGWGCALLLSILVWPVRWDHKRMLISAWIVKCFVTLVIMLPYEQQYEGLDCWTYFRQAHAGLEGMSGAISGSGGNIVIGLGAFHLAIGPDSYHAMKLSFAMIGFVGVYLLYRAGEVLLERPSPFAFWALLLYPSVLFWSSIIGKDPLMLAAIALNVWGVVTVTRRGGKIYLLAVLTGIAFASAIRVWMGPILLAPCLLLSSMRTKQTGWRITAVVLIVLALLTVVPATVSRLQLDKTEDLLEATRTVAEGWDRANSSLRLDVDLKSTWDLLLFTPQTIFIAYFRPLPGDIPNLFGWLAGCENLALLLLSLWALLRVRLRHFRTHLFVWAVALLATWGIAYSVIAYKDLGAAVRYKLQIIPILLGVIGYLCRRPAATRTASRAIGVLNRERTPQIGLTLP